MLCKLCFCQSVERDVFQFIDKHALLGPNQRVIIGASGGKDSTVLIHLMCLLNEERAWNMDLRLVSIDEGIAGYRDHSLATVQQNAVDYNLPLHIYSYQQLYNTTMDNVVKQIGLKNNCTVCGVFRRKALDIAASDLRADVIATGHNADDQAETNLLNLVRGDISRLTRRPPIAAVEGEATRCKPMIGIYQKDIVIYAHYRGLRYFSTECTYFGQSHRGYLRDLIKQLEAVNPACIRNINESLNRELALFEQGGRDESRPKDKVPLLGRCSRCQGPSSMNICKACNIEEGLNKDMPLLGVGKTQKIRKQQNMDPLVFYRDESGQNK